MAHYAALGSLVGLIEDMLVRERYPNFVRSKHKILESLHKKLILLEILLKEYSSEGVEVDDHVTRQIRDVSYQAQDAIETQIYLEETTHVLVKVFHRLISACQNAFSWQPKSRNWSQVLMEIEEQVDLIVQKVRAVRESWISEDSLVDDRYSSDNESSMLQAPVGNDDSVIGFEEHITTLIDQLCGYSTRLNVIAVTGMGGIGKTTLVRKIFNFDLIVYHFDCRVWVTVSQVYHKAEVLLSIHRSLGGKMDELDGGEQELMIKIYQHLYGRRYLVVLDDTWSTNVWEDMRQLFPDNRNGSRIIVTTRLKDVAHHMSTSGGFIQNMHLLDDEHSWNLFRMKVFPHDDYPDQELVEIGKSILAHGYRGLPLAISVIAGILSISKTPKYWKDIATKLTVLQSSEDLGNILSLSYNHLPLQLKSCILFMAIFPEDYEIDIFLLSQMWIAEGLLEVKEEYETLEQTAQDCLQDLVQRNLVIITKKGDNGQFLSCTMHDLVREFCQERAFYEDFFDVEEEEGYSHSVEANQVRRISLKWERGREIYLYNIGMLVRSILWFGARFHHDFGTIKWDQCKLLRILHVPDTRIWSLPDAIFQMFHLRYLTLNVFETHLPGSLSMLRNLQTLVIDVRMGSYAKLPPEFWTMTQLRHCLISAGMFLPPISSLSCIPAQKLKDLQTLMTVRDFRFTADSIGMIPRLKKLGIEYGRHYSIGGNKWEMNYLYNLVHLLHLEELSIRFALCNEQCIDSFPSSFAFPKNLTDLTLSGCRLPWEDMTMIGSLPLLQVLRLSHEACVGETWKPNEEEFLKLKFLLMEWLDLKCWLADSSHFPCLEHLEINACHELEEIPLDLGNIPTLEYIHVYDSKHAGISTIRIQDEQKDYGNDYLQVKVQEKRCYH